MKNGLFQIIRMEESILLKWVDSEVLSLHSEHQFLQILSSSLRPNFTSSYVQGLAFETPKFYIVLYGEINHSLINLSYNCDMKSGLRLTRLSDFS